MKSLYIACMAAIVVLGACNKKESIKPKQGISLPPVTGLTLTKGSGAAIRLNWQMPSAIPAGIVQPLSVQVELKELSGLQTYALGTIMLPNAPTSYEGAVPDAAKSYHITVKLNGQVTDPDPNYAGNIFSLGQTVIY